MQNCIFAGRKYYSHEGKSACLPQRLAHDLLRFAERKYYSCEGKSACLPQRLAHDLLRFAERKDTQSIRLLQTN